MSSFSEGQTHLLMNRLEAEGFTPNDVTQLGQYPDLVRLREVLRGVAMISYITRLLVRTPFTPARISRKHPWIISAEGLARARERVLPVERITVEHYSHHEKNWVPDIVVLEKVWSSIKNPLLDASDFLALWNDPHHAALNWLYRSQGITELTFWGTILQYGMLGSGAVLFLKRDSRDGRWHYDTVHFADHVYCRIFPIAVLSNIPSSE